MNIQWFEHIVVDFDVVSAAAVVAVDAFAAVGMNDVELSGFASFEYFGDVVAAADAVLLFELVKIGHKLNHLLIDYCCVAVDD